MSDAPVEVAQRPILELRCATPPAWLDAVLADFDAFLVDHAACERKASATGMAFVVRYPDRVALLEPLIAFAREELEHFHAVVRLVCARGLTLGPDAPDPYVKPLLAAVRTGRDERLLDRLLVAGVVEARGCERFGMVARALQPGELADFYTDITRSEARHHGLFLRLARAYFDEASIAARLDALLELEARILADLPVRAALH
jgi:tRNA 2-(methylsulfanyl)-N6-isopentenyladenosine37 hydroxylase